jgi:hypothetical protein
MTAIVLTLFSVALISNLVLQMPLAVDPMLAARARQRVRALGPGHAVGRLWLLLLGTQDNQALSQMTALSLGSGLQMLLAFLGFNAMIKA